MSFKTYALEDVLEITSSKRIKMADYVQSGIPFYRSKEIIEKSNNQPVSTDIFITCEHFDKIKMKFGAPEAGDILLTSVGTLGVSYQVSDDDLFYFKDGNLTWFRNFNNRVLSGYIYCWLKSPSARKKLDEISIGTTQRALTIASLKKILIKIPSLDVQKKIVFIYESLSKKIINNGKINQTLEQMAQALFKSWFVNFEPVKAKMAVLAAGGSQEDATLAAMTAISGKDADALAVFEREHPEQYAELKATAELFPSAMQDSELGAIPEGWNIGKLGDIIEFNPKRVLKKGNIAPYLDMKNVPVTGHSAQEIIDREFSSGSKFRNGDTLLARITPCLENGKTAFVDFLLTDEMIGWGSTEFIIMRSKKSLPLSLSYFLARLDYFRTIAIQSMQGTSGRQRADAFVLEQHIWVVPPNEILKKFGIFSDSVLNCNRARNAENNALTQLRDTLLPKLLSGEITLPEAEQIISEEA
ncbi:restriction endonuclease subunit S [Hafnia paralvei]|uniref:restriction endonuclease subunit S n=1 Tax=Hafnia paralvei TaxID=546367 RepID=UPI0024BAABB2|nr:restriction endonuclease subunit S [Hafnia paralvei]